MIHVSCLRLWNCQWYYSIILFNGKQCQSDSTRKTFAPCEARNPCLLLVRRGILRSHQVLSSPLDAWHCDHPGLGAQQPTALSRCAWHCIQCMVVYYEFSAVKDHDIIVQCLRFWPGSGAWELPTLSTLSNPGGVTVTESMCHTMSWHCQCFR